MIRPMNATTRPAAAPTIYAVEVVGAGYLTRDGDTHPSVLAARLFGTRRAAEARSERVDADCLVVAL
jgi:hypothetical protein